MSKILLTGVDGFTGKHLVNHLMNQGKECLSLDVDLTKKDLVEQSINDLCNAYDIEAVIHLAAISFVQHENLDEIYRVNVIGTENLLSGLSKANIAPKVILASSANIYGIPPNEKPLEEDCCPSPINHYACSKFSMEMMARNFRNKFPIIIVRPFNYTGVGQSTQFLVPKIVSHFNHRASEIELGNLDIKRDFSSINDVCTVYEKLLLIEDPYTVVNIASAHLVSIREILSFCEAVTGHCISVQQNSAFVRNVDIPAMSGSNQKLKALIGFAPTNENFWLELKQMLKSD